MGYIEWLRAKIGGLAIPVVYGSAIVRDTAGRILFQHRSDFGVWGLPGGVIEPGEGPATCAARETREETGLEIRILRLTAVLSSPRYNVTYPNGDRVQQITYFYEAAISGGSLGGDPAESTELAFFPEDALPPTMPWYQDAIVRSGASEPYFDPPEGSGTELDETPTWAVLRRSAGKEPLVMAGASCILRESGGRILLIRRRDTGLWAVPGGLLEYGESLAGTLVRETREECGLAVHPLRLRAVFGGHRVEFANGDVLYPIAAWFDCAAAGGVLHPDALETDQAAYFDPGDLPPMIPGLEARLRRALASQAGCLAE